MDVTCVVYCEERENITESYNTLFKGTHFMKILAIVSNTHIGISCTYVLAHFYLQFKQLIIWYSVLTVALKSIED